MKKYLLVLMLIIFLISCNEGKKEDQEVRYTQDSEQINTLRAAIEDYEKADWDAMKKHYADTAQIFHNSKEGKRIGAVVKTHQDNLTGLAGYSFDKEEDEFEMVLTDDGNTWVNYWGDWKGTMAGNNKEIIIPVHLTAQFENGKIVREYGYWDNTPMMMAMQEMDTTMVAQDSIKTPGN